MDVTEGCPVPIWQWLLHFLLVPDLFPLTSLSSYLSLKLDFSPYSSPSKTPPQPDPPPSSLPGASPCSFPPVSFLWIFRFFPGQGPPPRPAGFLRQLPAPAQGCLEPVSRLHLARFPAGVLQGRHVGSAGGTAGRASQQEPNPVPGGLQGLPGPPALQEEKGAALGTSPSHSPA